MSQESCLYSDIPINMTSYSHWQFEMHRSWNTDAPTPGPLDRSQVAWWCAGSLTSSFLFWCSPPNSPPSTSNVKKEVTFLELHNSLHTHVIVGKYVFDVSPFLYDCFASSDLRRPWLHHMTAPCAHWAGGSLSWLVREMKGHPST